MPAWAAAVETFVLWAGQASMHAFNSREHSIDTNTRSIVYYAVLAISRLMLRVANARVGMQLAPGTSLPGFAYV